MNVVKTYKFKLYRSKKNKRLYGRVDIAGQIWNHSIALHRRYYKLTGKFLRKYDLRNTSPDSNGCPSTTTGTCLTLRQPKM